MHTGQSLPNIRRSAPNASSTTSTYGARSSAVHAAWSASVIIPDSLHHTFGLPAATRHVGRPRLHQALADARLGDVVDDHPEGRQLGRQQRNVAEVLRPEKQVVRDVVPLEHGQPAEHVGPGQPVVVGLLVDEMADADQLRVAPQVGQRQLDVVGRSRQVDPADDPGDRGCRIGRGRAASASRRGYGGPARRPSARCRPRASCGSRSVRQEGRSSAGTPGPRPAIVERIRVPVVLVRVDPHVAPIRWWSRPRSPASRAARTR